MIKALDVEIADLVADIRDGRLLLPEMQRAYVWRARQVRDLFDSLYREYPSGQLLIWETDDIPFSRAPSLEGVAADSGRPQLLLDGQQRLTSLSAVMLGRELRLRGTRRPIDVVFNVFSERFEIAGSRRYYQEAGWISLAKLFTEGQRPAFRSLKLDLPPEEEDQVYARLARVENIRRYKYRVNLLQQLDYDTVTHIFVRINSGGSKLSNADLALAQISSAWRGVTAALDDYRERHRAKIDLDNGLLIRALTTLWSGQTRFARLFRAHHRPTVDELREAWQRVMRAMDQALAFLQQNCRIDRLSMLPTRNVLVPLVAYFDRFGAAVGSDDARTLQRWVYLAIIWSRYSGASETAMDQDIAALGKPNPIETMIQNIEDKVGRRPVTERELQDQPKDSAYMLMAYVLARHRNAQDWFNGVVIGGGQSLEYHHIFPRALFKEKQRDGVSVDQVANLAFLSDRANRRIAAQTPAEYLASIPQDRLKAQFIPEDPSVWKVDRFEDFVRARRQLLADGINDLLTSLMREPTLWRTSESEQLEARVDALERDLRELIEQRLVESFGSVAWDHGVPADIRKSVQHRVEQQAQRHPFQADESGTVAARLAYCQFSDYPKIVKSNWGAFEDVFGNQTVFDQHVRSATDARNAIKHGRELNSVERALGEAGLIWLEQCLRHAESDPDDAEDVA